MKSLNGWNRLFVLVSGLLLIVVISFDNGIREFGNNYQELSDDGFYESKLSETSLKLTNPKKSHSKGFGHDAPFSEYQSVTDELINELINGVKPKKEAEKKATLVQILVIKEGKQGEIIKSSELDESEYETEITFPNGRAISLKPHVSNKDLELLAKNYFAILKHEWAIKNFFWWVSYLTNIYLLPLVFIYIFGASLGWVWRGFRSQK